MALEQVAALFPGQGSQAIGMARDFYEKSLAARAVLDKAEQAIPGLLEIMWQGPEEVLKQTINQQPALVAAGAAAFAAYNETSHPKPSYVAGHSLGEFTAHVAAGSLTVTRAVKLVRKRGQYMQEAVPEGIGAMAAVMKVDKDIVIKVCNEVEGIVEIANYNSEAQTVISGAADAVNKASERLKESGAKVVPLAVSAPFHCSLMQGAADRLAQDLVQTEFESVNIPIVANVNASLVNKIEDIPNLLATQVTKSVRWTESMQMLGNLGIKNFIELGSGKVLTGLVKRILKGVSAKAVYDMSTLSALTSEE